MQEQRQAASQLAALHVKGSPLVLYNAWDAGSAKAVAAAGAPAIGTSSWALAAAHGYGDGEEIPLALVAQVAGRIAQSAALPVTVDIEGAYSSDPDTAAENVALLLEQGVAGINLEDRVVAGRGLYDIDCQCARIAAIRATAESRGVPLFINARTDVFFAPDVAPRAVLGEAIARAEAYARAGASGLFVPGLLDIEVIGELAAATALPLNVMMMPGAPSVARLAAAGVARISHGPAPYLAAMAAVEAGARAVLA